MQPAGQRWDNSAASALLTGIRIAKRTDAAKTQRRAGEPGGGKPHRGQRRHYPLYRVSDASCTGQDAAPPEERHLLFREKYDVLSKEASQRLLQWFKPRLILSGHTHSGCEVLHDNKYPEISVPSFSWRNRNNPSFILGFIDTFWNSRAFEGIDDVHVAQRSPRCWKADLLSQLFSSPFLPGSAPFLAPSILPSTLTCFPCSCWREPSPQHDAATTMSHVAKVENLQAANICLPPQASVSPGGHSLSKCFLPEESTVIGVYCSAGAGLLLLFLGHCLWMKGLLQLSLCLLGKHKSL
ncbi:hypothetical protein CCH79_00009672 [Gambusia affinis]|uniref:Metallophosphoesterase 1 n=1 Tax=Gambusia affinis TaxID=33528 RepID=A0A315W1V1_GAMAF|nr:hypothetical protein CCH79_00009672 [Gambusia affinis]